jgi:hypothetical protein
MKWEARHKKRAPLQMTLLLDRIEQAFRVLDSQRDSDFDKLDSLLKKLKKVEKKKRMVERNTNL